MLMEYWNYKDTWYYVEVSADNNGEAIVGRLNGVQFTSGSVSVTGLASIDVGNIYSNTGTWYIDDVKITDDSWPGAI